LKEEYITEVVAIFVRNNPPDEKGYFNGQMKRLEIEAFPKK
jgi:trans-aconitate 2-methyltransferase